MLMWILIYWIICGLILFSLTQPTVTVFNFPGETFWELIASFIFGGILVPLVLIVFLIYWIPVIIKGDKDD